MMPRPTQAHRQNQPKQRQKQSNFAITPNVIPAPSRDPASSSHNQKSGMPGQTRHDGKEITGYDQK